jgi:hypothetical protein
MRDSRFQFAVIFIFIFVYWIIRRQRKKLLESESVCQLSPLIAVLNFLPSPSFDTLNVCKQRRFSSRRLCSRLYQLHLSDRMGWTGTKRASSAWGSLLPYRRRQPWCLRCPVRAPPTTLRAHTLGFVISLVRSRCVSCLHRAVPSSFSAAFSLVSFSGPHPRCIAHDTPDCSQHFLLAEPGMCPVCMHT